MSDIPDKFDAKYYDEKYFADQKGKTYRNADGSTSQWGYKNKTGEWLGCKYITRAWKDIFKLGSNSKVLDVGCGRGQFVTYLRDLGIESFGFDFSDFAINNPYPRCHKDWIRIHDAITQWPYNGCPFDLVIVLDLFEHIYESDIDKVIDELYRVSKKWIFLQIATSGSGGLQGDNGTGYIIKKGDTIPIELEGMAVAGHVTVQPEFFWHNKLNRKGWILRKDIVGQFCSVVPHNVIANWLLNSIIVMEKV